MYVIKAIVGWVLPPGLFVIIALVLAIFAKRRQQRGLARLLFAFACLVYLCSIPAVADTLIRPLESAYEPPASVHGDVLVMLGGGATSDTPDVDGVGMLSGDAANRLLTTARLYKETKLPIVVSGGQVYPDDGVESEIAKRELMSLGVPASAIWVESQSRNTEENAKYTRVILAAHKVHHPVLITSAFHMQRAVLDFKKEGMSVEPYPCDYLTSVKSRWYGNMFVPSGQALANTWTALHEYLGVAEASLKRS